MYIQEHFQYRVIRATELIRIGGVQFRLDDYAVKTLIRRLRALSLVVAKLKS